MRLCEHGQVGGHTRNPVDNSHVMSINIHIYTYIRKSRFHSTFCAPKGGSQATARATRSRTSGFTKTSVQRLDHSRGDLLDSVRSQLHSKI
jgi:hypothetical protein